MINVKEAIDKAKEYLVTFFPEAENVELEEVELTADKSHWMVTLSFEGITSSVASEDDPHRTAADSSVGGAFRAAPVGDSRGSVVPQARFRGA